MAPTPATMRPSSNGTLAEESTLSGDMYLSTKSLSTIKSLPIEILLAITNLLNNRALSWVARVSHKMSVVATESMYRVVNLYHGSEDKKTPNIVTLYCALDKIYPPL